MTPLLEHAAELRLVPKPPRLNSELYLPKPVSELRLGWSMERTYRHVLQMTGDGHISRRGWSG